MVQLSVTKVALQHLDMEIFSWAMSVESKQTA